MKPRPEIERLDPYVPGAQPSDPTVIKLNTNENPYPPSPRVAEAIREAACRLARYPDPTAAAVRKRLGERFGVSPRQVFCGNGSDEILSLLVRAWVPQGGRVAFPDPTYSLYRVLAAIQGAEIAAVPFPADWSLPQGLAGAGARLTIVANPNSPSGTQVPAARIEELADRLDGLLVVDEAYAEFAEEDCTGLAARRPDVVVVRTLSKSHSLAGLRFGFALGGVEAIATLAKVSDSYNVGTLPQAAALVALDDEETMRRNVRRVVAERERLARELAVLGYEVTRSASNFLLVAPPGPSAGQVFAALEARRILVRWFDTPRLARYLRVTVGTPAQGDALLAALKEIHGSRP